MQKFFRILPKPRIGSYFLQSFLCSVDRHMMLSRKNAKALDVVGMLMGNDHSVQLRALESDIIQALFYTLIAYSGVHQNMGLIGTYINAVSAAAAGNAY